MTIIMHIHKTGETCRKPSFITTPAGYIKAGDILEIGEMPNAHQVYWNGNAYIVAPVNDNPGDVYEFHNFNCAAAKLAELGRK